MYIIHAVQALHVSKTIRSVRFVPDDQLCRSPSTGAFKRLLSFRVSAMAYRRVCFSLHCTTFHYGIYVIHVWFSFSSFFSLSISLIWPILVATNLVVPYEFVSVPDGVCLFEYCCKRTASNHTWCCWAAIQEQNAAEASLLCSGKQVSFEDNVADRTSMRTTSCWSQNDPAADGFMIADYSRLIKQTLG